MNHSGSLNCAVIGAKKGKWILKDIGDVFGVTRMRICQIEKEIMQKLATVSVLDVFHPEEPS